MNRSVFATFALAASALLLSGSNASAALITTISYGGHTYELWSGNGNSWLAAKAAAEAQGGYLAVLTTDAEIAAVYNGLIGHDFFQPGGIGSQGAQAWLGGYTTDPDGSTDDPFAWAWVNGEAWTPADAANFANLEPNGDSSGLAINRYGTFEFNDEGEFTGGYIVEKNSVPDGGMTVAMLGLVLAGIALYRKKSDD